MENTITTRQFNKLKKELPEMIHSVQQAKKNRKYIYHYFGKYLKPELDTYRELSKSCLEYICTLCQTGHLSQKEKNELSKALEELIMECKKLTGADKDYFDFLEDLADKAGISLCMENKGPGICNYLDLFSIENCHLPGDIGLMDSLVKILDEVVEMDGITDDGDGDEPQSLTDDEHEIMCEMLTQEELDGPMFFAKSAFWITFIILKQLLDTFLEEKNEYVVYYARNRKRFKKNVEKYYSDYNFVGLLDVYLQIVNSIITGMSSTIKRRGRVNIDHNITDVSFFYDALDFCSMPGIPYTWTLYFNQDPAELKSRLKEQRDRLKGENIWWMIVKSVQTHKELFEGFVSCLEENQDHLFAKTMFAISHAFRTTD